MDGDNNGKPYEQMDDLGGFPLFFGNSHEWVHIPLPFQQLLSRWCFFPQVKYVSISWRVPSWLVFSLRCVSTNGFIVGLGWWFGFL